MPTTSPVTRKLARAFQHAQALAAHPENKSPTAAILQSNAPSGETYYLARMGGNREALPLNVRDGDKTVPLTFAVIGVWNARTAAKSAGALSTVEVEDEEDDE